MFSVSIVGSGNVASHLGKRLFAKGLKTDFVFSRNKATGTALAGELACKYSDNIQQLSVSDIILLCVPDSQIREISRQIPASGALVVHVSGNTPLASIDQKHTNAGVFWPMQSFSKEAVLSWDQMPIVVENRGEKEELLFALATTVTGNVFQLSEAKRKKLHLAAVLVNNFTNALYTEAEKLLKKEDLEFKMLLPLIEETVQKLKYLSPKEAQTGPALRGDKPTLDEHRELLKDDPELREIYELMSRRIGLGD